MAKRVVTRGNTLFFTFTFYDEDGDVAIVSSAEVQLTYPGLNDFVTETVTLQSSGNSWVGEWDSSKARPGWLEYHAHGYAAGGINYGDDGRTRLRGNRANMDHDALPTSGTASTSARLSSNTDYGSLS